MAHYAYLDENNIVINVIVGRDENEEGINWEEYYNAKRTSYNTHGNKHPNGTPFRKNYAAIGYFYDEKRDAFIPPKPYDSWVLDEDSCLWNPPIPMPQTGNWYWDEETQDWIPAE